MSFITSSPLNAWFPQQCPHWNLAQNRNHNWASVLLNLTAHLSHHERWVLATRVSHLPCVSCWSIPLGLWSCCLGPHSCQWDPHPSFMALTETVSTWSPSLLSIKIHNSSLFVPFYTSAETVQFTPMSHSLKSGPACFMVSYSTQSRKDLTI